MIKFSGTDEEFGRFVGEKMLVNNHDFCPNVDPYVFRRQLKIYKKYYPEFINYCKGIADVMGMSEQQVFYNETCLGLGPRKGCTIFSVKDGGKIYVGRNYDWMPRVRNVFNQYEICLNNKIRYFAFSDEGTWPKHLGHRTWEYMAEDAINEHGLYIGLTFSHINTMNYGIRSLHALRYVAEHCKNTKEALAAFSKIPLRNAQNFLIADKKGESAVVQHYVKGYDVIRPDERGVLILTNHILSQKNQHLDRVRIDDPTHDTFVRYAETEYLITKQLAGINGNTEFQFTDIGKILRKSHYIYNEETIWSLALELSEGRYDIYYDTVNGQVCEKLSF